MSQSSTTIQNLSLFVNNMSYFITKEFLTSIIERHHFGHVSRIFIKERTKYKNKKIYTKKTAEIYFYKWHNLPENIERQNLLHSDCEFTIYYDGTNFINIKLNKYPTFNPKASFSDLQLQEEILLNKEWFNGEIHSDFFIDEEEMADSQITE